MKPYYQDEFVEIYLGDCLEILPELNIVETIITDPIWPNNSVLEFAGINPYTLFDNFLKSYAGYKRIAVQLGIDSNPDLLKNIKLPFCRTVNLEYALPSHKGRLLNTGDIAYLYGEVPKARPGFKLVPGRCISTASYGKETKHPCPRKLEHVRWLVHYWSNPDDIILDPFMGSGTTLLAAKEYGRKAIGIDNNEAYCKMTVNRLRQNILQFGNA